MTANAVTGDCDAWAAILGEIATRPLDFCPSFPVIAQRFEGWWNQAVRDRPLFVATAHANPDRAQARHLNLLADPARWFAAKLTDLREIHWVGDAIPNLRVDFGPVLLGGLFGGRIEFGAETTWTHAFIADDWSNEPDWQLQPAHPLWQRLLKLSEWVASDATGRYLLSTPDLGGGADVLLNLRGSAGLCLDVLEQPERVPRALDAIFLAWRVAFRRLYEIALARGTGLIHWLPLWSHRPYVVSACDFNYLIGPREFQTLCLPDVARQAQAVGRAVFHLDGPLAARHIDALLDVPALQAIQFTPGEGTPSALAWVEMFRKIQKRGKSVLVICPADEVLALCNALRPEGLAIWVKHRLRPAEVDVLWARFCARYGVRP